MRDLDRIFTVCPNCAENKKIEMWRTIVPKKLRRYYLHCGECGYTSERALTVRGAIKKWSRAWRRRFLSEIT